MLSECLNAINELSRHGGFAPCQWVLSRFTRAPATQGDEQEHADIGAIQGRVDGATAFAIQSKYRQKAREAFIKWDCGERVQRAILRKAAPVRGAYNVGDIVSYCRDPRSGESGLQWSVGSRIIGFESDFPEDANGLPVVASKPRMYFGSRGSEIIKIMNSFSSSVP